MKTGQSPTRFCQFLAAAFVVVFPALVAAQDSWNPEEVLKKEGWVKPPAVVERIITLVKRRVSRVPRTYRAKGLYAVRGDQNALCAAQPQED